MDSVSRPEFQESYRGERLASGLIDDLSDLVSPPEVYVKISSMLGENTASANEFAEVILYDPSLAARVLRMVNSPYYALRNKVDTVSQAVAIIGMTDLSNVVYSMCAVQTFSRISNGVTNMKRFGATASTVAWWPRPWPSTLTVCNLNVCSSRVCCMISAR